MGFASVDAQLAHLLRGAVDVYVEAELRDKLARSRKSGQPLRIKAGFDPTAPDLHLGHTVVLTKMRHFQDLGHHIIFLIGDFTGMIGDPTGRGTTRKALCAEEIQANARTYTAQVFKLLDPEKTEIAFNSKWMRELGAEGMIRLAAKHSVARMMERDDFCTRYQAGRTIGIHEFLYPLVQAYDSVALRADVELGGTDQLFNVLVGRQIMKSYGLEPQCVLTTPLLEGLDGRLEGGVIVGKKMSKSLGNYVGVDEPPLEIFGKLMSISDDLMWRYYDLLSTQPPAALGALRRRVAGGEMNPRDAKLALASELVGRYHGASAAEEASAEWRRIFSRRELPRDIPTVEISAAGQGERGVRLAAALRTAKLVSSGGEARRMLSQGAVRVDGVRVHDADLVLASGQRHVVRVGKRRFATIVVH